MAGGGAIEPPAERPLYAKQSPRGVAFSRVTLTQEIRVLLPPADWARKVQIIIPPGPAVFMQEDLPVDVNADGSASPGLPGRNRVYKLPILQPDQQIEFILAKGQWLVGAVAKELSHVTFIVEPV